MSGCRGPASDFEEWRVHLEGRRLVLRSLLEHEAWLVVRQLVQQQFIDNYIRTELRLLTHILIIIQSAELDANGRLFCCMA